MYRGKEDWHRPDLFRPTDQMWPTPAAAESGRRRVRPVAVPVRRLLLHPMKDLYHQLRLLTSPVSLHFSFQLFRSKKQHPHHQIVLQKIFVSASNRSDTKMFCLNLLKCSYFFWKSRLGFKITQGVTIFCYNSFSKFLILKLRGLQLPYRYHQGSRPSFLIHYPCPCASR